MTRLVAGLVVGLVVSAIACVAGVGRSSSAAAPARAAVIDPEIQIEDVARFYKVYDAAAGQPTAEQLQREYLDAGSEGLHRLAQLRRVTGAAIADAIAQHPAIFRDAKRCMAVLPRVRTRVAASLRRLGTLYPEAEFPPVTIAISRGKPIGVADAKGVMIGLEALCAVTYLESNLEDRVVHVIAHEYTHVQQAIASPALYDREKPTVLEESLIEGAAEFTAELISGRISYVFFEKLPRERATAIETEFIADEDKTDLSHWLYNGTLTEPGDLGYWVGYRIAKSYLEHARDKQRALRDILQMTDARALLAKSGWRPGIRLRQ